MFKNPKLRDQFLKGLTVVLILFVIWGIFKTAVGAAPLKQVNVGLFGGGLSLKDEVEGVIVTGQSAHRFSRVDIFLWGGVGTANILIVLFFLSKIRNFPFKNILRLSILLLLVGTASRAGWVIFYFLFLIYSLLERKLFRNLVISAFVFLFIIAAVPFLVERFLDTFRGMRPPTYITTRPGGPPSRCLTPT